MTVVGDGRSAAGSVVYRRWRSREIETALPMTVAHAMWGRAWRVDAHACERLGTRRATVLLCAEEPGSETPTPIGWCSMHWHLTDDVGAVIDHLAWDGENGMTEDDAWRALNALAGDGADFRFAVLT